MPVMGVIKKFLDSLTDEVLKKESKTESKNEALTVIIKVKYFESCVSVSNLSRK